MTSTNEQMGVNVPLQGEELTITKAQKGLLKLLDDGYEVQFKNQHYVATKSDDDRKIWPSTFYGLFDGGLVTPTDDGGYTISISGKKELNNA
jgi:hypothetical protein